MNHLLLGLSLLFASCGYHLAGQGDFSVIPEDVQSVALEAGATQLDKQVKSEMVRVWSQGSLPALYDEPPLNSEQHVVIRIEQLGYAMRPVAYNSSGLAIQHNLELSGQLYMYRNSERIWQSGRLSEGSDIFGGGDPSVTEAERERLSDQLQQRWVKRAIKSLKSGF